VRLTAFAPPGRDRSLEANLLVFASTLAAYLGVVYVFSYSQAASSSRHAIHLAILMMDAVIALALARSVFSSGGLRRRAAGDSPLTRPLLRLAVWTLLTLVVLLHADYALARSRGAEDGLAGSLAASKTYLLAGQLALVYSAALLRAPAGVAWLVRAFSIGRGDLLLLTVVLIPLVNYLAHNRELFSALTAIEYLAFFLAWPVAAAGLVRILEAAVQARALAVPLVSGLTVVHYLMPLLSSVLQQPVEALLPVQLGAAIGLAGALAVSYRLNPGTTARAAALVAACSVLATVVQAQFAGASGRESAVGSAGSQDLVPSPLDALLAAPLARRPDVHLLVYDGYAPSALLRRYGVDDDSDEFLARHGFRVHGGAYSLFMASRPSMASLMDMRASPQAGIGGPTTATRFFRGHGYETHLILNAYLLQGSLPLAADVVFPPWRHRSGLGALYRGIGGGEFKPSIVFQDSNRDEWLAAKRAVLTAGGGPPRMLYAHSGFPGHSQNSGACLPDETAAYAARLAVARQEMREDIEAILRGGRESIIIVAADHGPFLTGDCLYMARHGAHDLTGEHLADRYGTKLAVRWPDEAAGRFDRTEILQDVFFAVAAVLLEDERVWLHRPPARTVGYGGIPDGAVSGGVVMTGPDRGRRLFPPDPAGSAPSVSEAGSVPAWADRD
jgi:hypothetical protein